MILPTVMERCQCEHADHFHEGEVGKKHLYGVAFETLIAKLTPYGTFLVCKQCANDCYKMFPNGLRK